MQEAHWKFSNICFFLIKIIWYKGERERERERELSPFYVLECLGALIFLLLYQRSEITPFLVELGKSVLHKINLFFYIDSLA